jgi:hypothetical protein
MLLNLFPEVEKSMPDRLSPKQYLYYFDRINRIFRIIVLTLSGIESEGTIPLTQENIQQFIR